MARTKGRGADDLRRQPTRTKDTQKRRVYVYAEGEVTERQYTDLILEMGTPATPGHEVEVRYMNENGKGDARKPLPMVKQAVKQLRVVEREAEKNGQDEEKDWNWPQVWVLFDRDAHKDIPQAFGIAKDAGVRIAYSHPCFELWRLLHYQNYTSTFGGVCGGANGKLRQQPGFAQTYGKNVQRVSEQQSKHLHAAQILTAAGDGSRYATAKRFAQKINKQHGGPDQNTWDPYTDVWSFVEDGLLLSGY